MVAKDKFLREEILIPAVSKKFTFIRFSLPLYHISSHFSLMSLSSRQAEAAKKVKKEAEAAKKSLRAELLILAVSKKFTFIQFSLPLYHVSSHFSLMSLSG